MSWFSKISLNLSFQYKTDIVCVTHRDAYFMINILSVENICGGYLCVCLWLGGWRITHKVVQEDIWMKSTWNPDDSGLVRMILSAYI